MRILLISQYWEPENGVPQRRWSWLANVLEKAGHELFVVAPPPHYKRRVSFKEWLAEKGYRSKEDSCEINSNRVVLRSGYVPGGDSISQKALNQIAVAAGAIHVIVRRPGKLAGFQPDLVIGTVPAIPTAFVAALAARRFKAPYVIDLRDAWPELLTVSDRWNAAMGEPSLRQRILSKGPLQIAVGITNIWLNQVLKHASAVISTSSRLEKKLQARYPESQKTYTVRNVFPPETLIAKEPLLDGPNDTLNVLYAGTLGRAQNLANALWAAKEAELAGVHVRLRFVGAGAAKCELVELADRLGIEATFESYRSAELLRECYEWADTALVHLTDWSPLVEAVPSKTYELMNQGLHISGVVQGETADIIRRLKAGDVVEPESPEALAQLWVGLAENRSMLQVSDTGRRWVRHNQEVVAPATIMECVEWVYKTHQ